METVAKSLMVDLSDSDPRRPLERMFGSTIRRISDPRFPRGCLITNTSLECPSSGDEIARKIADGISRQESAIYRVLRRAQAEGVSASTVDASALARFFLTVAQGLNVMNKAVADTDALKDTARIAMSVWDEAGGARKRGSGRRQPSPGSGMISALMKKGETGDRQRGTRVTE